MKLVGKISFPDELCNVEIYHINGNQFRIKINSYAIKEGPHVSNWQVCVPHVKCYYTYFTIPYFPITILVKAIWESGWVDTKHIRINCNNLKDIKLYASIISVNNTTTAHYHDRQATISAELTLNRLIVFTYNFKDYYVFAEVSFKQKHLPHYSCGSKITGYIHANNLNIPMDVGESTKRITKLIYLGKHPSKFSIVIQLKEMEFHAGPPANRWIPHIKYPPKIIGLSFNKRMFKLVDTCINNDLLDYILKYNKIPTPPQYATVTCTVEKHSNSIYATFKSDKPCNFTAIAYFNGKPMKYYQVSLTSTNKLTQTVVIPTSKEGNYCIAPKGENPNATQWKIRLI